MRIIHLVASKEWGGAEIYAFNLAKEQEAHGHTVEFICSNQPLIVNRFRDAGFKVTTMQINGHINLLSPFKIASICKSSADKQTAIHLHRIVNTPLVTRAISILPKNKRPAFVCTVHFIEQARSGKKFERAYKAIDKIIFVSEKCKDGFLSSSPNIDREKLIVIYNSTKVSPFLTSKNGVNFHQHASLLFIGRLYDGKGIDTLIEALPKISNSTLTICGTGKEAYVNDLKELAKQLGVDSRIKWVGFSDNVADHIAKSNIGIIPSRCEDACPLVNFEYMASGIPMVASNRGGLPELITDSVEGFLVPADNPEALAEAVQKLIDNPELRKKMGEAARKTFENRFTYDKFYNQVMDVYKSALAAQT